MGQAAKPAVHSLLVGTALGSQHKMPDNKRQYIQPIPSRFELSVLYVLLGAHFVLGSSTGIPSGWLPFVAISFWVIVLWFVFRTALAVIQFRVVFQRLSRWIEAASVIAVLVILHTTTIGLCARVYLSERDLQMWAQQTQSVKGLWKVGAVPCGLFTFQSMIYKDGVTWMEADNGSRFFQLEYADVPCMHTGLAYSERGTPPRMPPAYGQSYYHHLYGPWWLWLDSGDE
jgi:hypothetical protein